MSIPFDQHIIQKCYSEVFNLHQQARELEVEYEDELAKIPSNYRASALNLLHYLALRKNDIRNLQTDLSNLGLSSLGRSESHVIASLENVMGILQSLSNSKELPGYEVSRPFKNKTGKRILSCHADQLLGLSTKNRNTRIMVTLPTHTATNPILVRELVSAGMNVARINCAHDKESDWMKMINHIREAEQETGNQCLVLMDLAGPKLRIGEIEPSPATLRIKPAKDARGMVIKPAILKILPDNGISPRSENNEIAIEATAFETLETGDVLKFRDIPNRKREIRVFLKQADHMLAEVKKTTYIENGISFRYYRDKKKIGKSLFKGLPPMPGEVKVYKGDNIIITNEQPGTPAKVNPISKEQELAKIPCSIPQIFSQVNPHESILFDEGKIAGTIEKVSPDAMNVLLTRVGKKGATLTSDKGINFPDSDLNIHPITDFDRQCLDFALQHADIVGFSFVKYAEDIDELIGLMDKQTQRMVGLVLKIETRKAFENLPFLLLTGLKRPPLGVMVARGDLGIEMGFERMAEVQEEILWLCEAAHVPVIWATQVLEQMNKKGLPSRSEVTDAAMSSRAECVMLNKGTYMVETVKFLDNILTRMQNHQQKKTPTLRRLKVTENL